MSVLCASLWGWGGLIASLSGGLAILVPSFLHVRRFLQLAEAGADAVRGIIWSHLLKLVGTVVLLLGALSLLFMINTPATPLVLGVGAASLGYIFGAFWATSKVKEDMV